jgi:hypothetical protein
VRSQEIWQSLANVIKEAAAFRLFYPTAPWRNGMRNSTDRWMTSEGEARGTSNEASGDNTAPDEALLPCTSAEHLIRSAPVRPRSGEHNHKTKYASEQNRVDLG